MSAVLIAALALVAIAAATYPLFKLDLRPQSANGLDTAYENLLSQREAAYSAIKDLEFDHAQGKISDADYTDLRAKYETKALGILQQLEAFGRPAMKSASGLLHLPNHGCPQCGEPFQGNDRFCRSCGAVLGQRCRTCGAAISSDDKFCARCGTPGASL
jgi:hypothetical protein